MAPEVHFTTDPAVADEATRSFLERDPVVHNVVLTLLGQRRRDGDAIRYWWATGDAGVHGALFQSPADFTAVVAAAGSADVGPLARAAAAADPALPGVQGAAGPVAAFAGEYATASRSPARPVEGQRIYEVSRLHRPAAVDGAARPAGPADVALVEEWVGGFFDDTDAPRDADPRSRARRMVSSGLLHLWEAGGEPRSCAQLTAPEAGVARVGFVYTPPAHRARGFAAAITAELTGRALDAGHRCILYTQLSNPTSNAIYRRLGYEPVADVVRYAFG